MRIVHKQAVGSPETRQECMFLIPRINQSAIEWSFWRLVFSSCHNRLFLGFKRSSSQPGYSAINHPIMQDGKEASDRDGGRVPQRTAPLPPQSLLRRYKWSELSVAERDAVNDALGLALTRSGVGLGAVLTVAAVVSNGTSSESFFSPLSLCRSTAACRCVALTN